MTQARNDTLTAAHEAQSKARVMQPLDLKNVALGGEFARRIEKIIEANILKIDVDKVFLADFCERREVDLGLNGRFVGLGLFIDSVVRLAYATSDERLLALKKKMIGKLLAVQESDGYIGVFQDPKQRVEVIWDLHEGAYLIWAFVTDYRLFDESASLAAARRLADFFLARFAANPALQIVKPIDVTFEVADIGWDLALLALSDAAGEAKYRDFVVEVLKLPELDPPIRCGTTTFANHVYAYLSHCLAQLDLYRQEPDPKLLRTSHKVLDFLRKGDGLLITGSASLWECWHDTQCGQDNLSETCVGAYLARFMETMLQVEGESLYGDILERNIYNALFAATSPDGSKTRYFTPFEGERPYDSNAPLSCCPNNNKRFLADLRGWIYYRTEQGIAVNLYNASAATVDIVPGVTLRLKQQTDYPTSGNVLIKVDPSKDAHFEVKLRIPRWCKEASVAINGAAPTTVAGGRFHGIARQWKAGDVIELSMPMTWRLIRGRKSQSGRAAILRGPVIFAFNPARNAELAARPGFDRQCLKINPLTIDPPLDDESVRPGGIACRIEGWVPGMQPWLIAPRVPIVLSEYPDPGAQSIYFLAAGEGISLLTDDELI